MAEDNVRESLKIRGKPVKVKRAIHKLFKENRFIALLYVKPRAMAGILKKKFPDCHAMGT